MQMVTNATGAVQLTLTDHEAQLLEEFLALAAMSLMTWPRCVGDYMTRRKVWHAASAQGADPPAA
jgi:hypothetical protein